MVSGKFLRVKAKFIHPSLVIPPRSHEYGLVESVKAVGVQQPMIVRPLASKSGEYDVIDGDGRRDALDPEQEVWVDVRQVSDAEAFKISDSTSKTTRRNTYENAAFYDAYIKSVKTETGEKGALARVKKETQISESELSQYQTINKLFQKLFEAREGLDEPFAFSKLETVGINKLYKLADLLENPGLLEAAREIEEKADTITLEGISAIVENLQPDNMERALAKILDFGDGTNSANVVSVNAEKGSLMETRFKDLKEKITAMAEEANTTVQSLEMEKLPATESTISILGKMSVCFRRSLYYANKLKEQKDGCQKAE
jgi:hypothetical protein